LPEGTSPRFQTAIAAGLAQPHKLVRPVDQQAAQFIQQAVAGFQDDNSSFVCRGAGDLSTAATGGCDRFCNQFGRQA